MVHGDCVPAEEGASRSCFDWQRLVDVSRTLRLNKPVATVLLLADDLVCLGLPDHVIQDLTGRSAKQLRQTWFYRTMRTAALPQGTNLWSARRRRAMWLMEHYPLPRWRTWFDPLTWTKRIQFSKDD